MSPRVQAHDAPSNLLTVAETAARLRHRPAAIRSMAHRRLLPFYRVGKAILFDPAAIDAFLSECYRPSAREARAASASGDQRNRA